MHSVEVLIAADHPSAAGHFPGNPIVPGAVLLSEVFAAWQRITGDTDRAIALRSAKFISPTRPGDRVSIHFDSVATGSVKFTCAVGPTLVVSGVLGYTP